MVTVSLDGQGTYRSIGAAVAAAPDGATISVEPGHYPESLALTRPVTITAAQARGSVVVAPPAARP